MGGLFFTNVEERREPYEVGQAQGYSWGGTHDVGWVDQVGFSTIANTGSLIWRSNVVSCPFLQWTTLKPVTVNVIFTVGNLKDAREDNSFFFGIWSSAQGGYMGDNPSYFPNGSGIPLRPELSGPFTITVKNIKLSSGDSLFFLARSLLPTFGSAEAGVNAFEFQSIEITAAP